MKELCFGLPECLAEFIKYIKGLEFTQKPDYNYCRGLFDRHLKDKCFVEDKYDWDWDIQREKLIKKKVLEAENQRFEQSLRGKKLAKRRKEAMREKMASKVNLEMEK